MMRISDIRIGDRSRKDLGDISSLAQSIETVGLLHPVVVSKDGTLIAGARRIAAFTMLGRDEIPHTIADSLQDVIAFLRAEHDENTERKDFTPSEAVVMADRLGPLEKKAAQERQASQRKIGSEKPRAEKVSEREKGRAADKIAAAVGMSRTTLMRAKAVMEAAKKDPERYGSLAEQMDSTGNVRGAFRALADRGGIPAKKIVLTKDEKVAKIRAMSSKGYTAAQIASEIGVNRKRVVHFAKEAGIELPDSLMGRTRKIDVNRIISETVNSAESLSLGLELIDGKLDEVDISKVDGWISTLRSSISAVNKLIKILERIDTNGNQ